MYCAIHKTKNMVNIYKKYCAHEGCQKNPAYNYVGQKKGIYSWEFGMLRLMSRGSEKSQPIWRNNIPL